MIISLLMAYGQRLEPNWFMRTAVRIAAMYPLTVINLSLDQGNLGARLALSYKLRA